MEESVECCVIRNPGSHSWVTNVLGRTYFANIDESAHEVLVAERIDRVLSLIPRLVFHNSMAKSVHVLMRKDCRHTYPQPYIHRGTSPTRQPQSFKLPEKAR